MKSLRAVFTAMLCLIGLGVAAQPPDLSGIQFQKGPDVCMLGDIAQVRIPAGYVFAGPDDTRVLMESMENPASGAELGFILCMEEKWFVIFEFEETGYIRDDEKDSLDADAMLASLKAGNDRSNEERRRRGWAEMTLTGWAEPPNYDTNTNNLQWAVRGESEGEESINFNTRLLGRSGVMSATLVTDPATLAQNLPAFKDILLTFEFLPGHRYAEYRAGDKLAAYGLSALVVGGVAAVAVKSGAAKWIWKVLVFGAIAVASVFRRFFSNK